MFKITASFKLFRFYRDILSLGEWAKLAFLDDLIIGAVCARVGMLLLLYL